MPKKRRENTSYLSPDLHKKREALMAAANAEEGNKKEIATLVANDPQFQGEGPLTIGPRSKPSEQIGVESVGGSAALADMEESTGLDSALAEHMYGTKTTEELLKLFYDQDAIREAMKLLAPHEARVVVLYTLLSSDKATYYGTGFEIKHAIDKICVDEEVIHLMKQYSLFKNQTDFINKATSGVQRKYIKMTITKSITSMKRSWAVALLKGEQVTREEHESRVGYNRENFAKTSSKKT